MNKENYVLSEEELRRLQMTELELLKEVHRICAKCNIRYNIIAGTLLGAVRHKGFIPWDDDADVAMLREEYDRFKETIKTELDTVKYEFQDMEETEGYRWGYGKLRMKNTLFLRQNQEHMPYFQGVFIDIFPLDAVSDIHFIRAIQNFRCFIIRKAMWARVGRYYDKGRMARLLYRILDSIPEEKLKKDYAKYVEKCNRNKNTEWVRILLFPTPNKEFGYRRKWYEESAPIEFENVKFEGIKDYDEYLAFKFGNYMELPPVSQRKTHPVVELKL